MRNVAEIKAELAQATIVAWVGVVSLEDGSKKIVPVSSETWNDFGVGDGGEIRVVAEDHYDGGVRFLAEVVETAPKCLYHRGIEERIWCARFQTEAEARQWVDSFVPPSEE